MNEILAGLAILGGALAAGQPANVVFWGHVERVVEAALGRCMIDPACLRREIVREAAAEARRAGMSPAEARTLERAAMTQAGVR